MNKLFYGDNLEVLREHIRNESVDLVYLDPPFNSNARYNLLFTTPDGDVSAAQSSAFHDTWSWGPDAAQSYDEVMASGSSAAEILRALRSFLRESDMMSYLSMMTVRLIEMYRSLSPTGSLYLHCDPTASHYLKIILDGIFGGPNFRTEIVWKRSSAHSDAKQGRKQHGRIHDVLLFYTKGSDWTWNQIYTPYDQEYVDKFYRYVEEGSERRYRLGDLTGPGGAAKGNPRYKVMGVERYWRYSKDRMERLITEGRVVQTGPGKVPQYKRYLDEMPGVAIQDIWTDISPISPQARERLGYPTQKPLALLQRIIEASSNPGDVVLDPFCGCGTTVHAAQALGRSWIGIDVTHYAIELIEGRLRGFNDLNMEIEGRPRDIEAAYNLAQRDKFQFQWWANWLVGVQNYHERKKGSDRGIDGTIFFKNGPMGTGRILVSVKGGERISVRDMRDLRGTVEREGAELGLLVVLHQPTRDMVREAAASGTARTAHGRIPRLQIATVEDLLDGKYPNLPPRYEFPREGKRPILRDANDKQLSLPLSIGGGKGSVKEYPSPDVLFGIGEEQASR